MRKASDHERLEIRLCHFRILLTAYSNRFAQPELKGTIPELSLLLTNAPRIVHITGEAEIKVQADRAIITVKVTTTARELAQALRANQQARSKFIRRFRGKNIFQSSIPPIFLP